MLEVVRLLTFILAATLSLSAAQRPDPPTFIVDAHGNPWIVESVKWIGEDEVGHPYVGMTDEDSHRIRLLWNRTLAEEQESLLHELSHVVMGTEHSYDKVTVHQCIYDLSEGLTAIFHENPDLLRYLAARESGT